jgi:DNA-binding MarR family transcriptional regulator
LTRQDSLEPAEPTLDDDAPQTCVDRDQEAALPSGERQLDVELRYLVLAAQREGNRLLSRELSPLGLTPAQAEVLLVLADREPLTLVEVGRYLVCETGSPSRIVDTMVRRGLVQRAPGQRDRRVIMLRLSPGGRALLPALREVDQQITETTSGRLSQEEKEIIAAALRRLINGTPGGDTVARRFGAAAPE